MKDFKNISVWVKAHDLALETYKATARFPRDEIYGLVSQLRRAAVSIPANIAEGCGRSGDAELRRFMDISLGSAYELEYHLLLSRDLGFIGEADYAKVSSDVVEVKRMLSGFIQTLREGS